MNTKVALIGLDSLPYNILIDDLEKMEFQVTAVDTIDQVPSDCGLTIVFGKPQHFEAFNKLAKEKAISWMPVEYSYAWVRMGPLVVPSETPCYHCLKLRMDSHGMTPMAAKPKYFEVSFGMVSKVIALEVIKWTTRDTNSFVPLTLNHVFELDAFHVQGELFPVYRVPSCPVCGPMHSSPSFKKPWERVMI